jgi:hypothetical protein
VRDKRQNTQLELAFGTEERGEAPSAAPGGTEARAARTESDDPAAWWVYAAFHVAQSAAEPPYTDPYVRWCSGGAARLPPIPIQARVGYRSCQSGLLTRISRAFQVRGQCFILCSR